MMILWPRYLKHCRMNPLVMHFKVILYNSTKGETVF